MAGAESEWEVCNDAGFVYKRRRRVSAEPTPADLADQGEMRLKRRNRRKGGLVLLRERYRRELEVWGRVGKGIGEVGSVVPVNGEVVSVRNEEEGEGLEVEGRLKNVEELIDQMETQEAILNKLNELFNHIDWFCEQKEEKLFDSVVTLPIWKNAETLYESLTT